MYGQPIGSIITTDVVPKADLQLPNAFPTRAGDLIEGDIVLHESMPHKVKGVTDLEDDVLLTLEDATGKEKDKKSNKASIFTRIVLGVAATIIAGIAAMSAGMALGGGSITDVLPEDRPTHSAPDMKNINPPLNEMKAKPAPNTVKGYEKMFHDIDPAIWGAADVSISQELPDGRRVWLYGDTFSDQNKFVHSTAIVQDGGNLHVSEDGKQLLPNGGTIRKDGRTFDRIYWIETADLMDNGNLRISTMPIAMGDQNVWDFFRIRENESRIAEVSVNEAGDLKFEGWRGYTERPALTTDGEDWTMVGDHHFTYQHTVHDIKLKNGEYLKTMAQNWDDEFSNHVDPKTGGLRYEDFRPLWSSSKTMDTGFEPNEWNLPSEEWHDFEQEVARQMEQGKSVLDRAAEMKDRVRTPEGAAHYGQPIGSVIRRDAAGNIIRDLSARASDIALMGSPKTGEPAQRDARVSTTGYTQRMRSKARDARFSVAQGKGPNSNPPNIKGSKHLWELPSDYDGYDLWVDARNLRMYVAQEDDGMFVAYDVNSEVIEEGDSRADLIKKLEDFAAIELKPGCKWATPADRKRLVTPPAWRSVQIPIDQKTTRMKMQGYDSKGKQQTQYTAEQDEIRDAVKFERTKQLQKKMRTLDAYLKKNTGEENSDCIMMMRRLGMRPDRGGSGADVETFGATSLQAKHVKVTPTGLVTLKFTPGKKKEEVTIKVRDKVLADMLRERLKDKSHSTPLFEVNVDKVEKEFRNVVGQGFNLKDLRTLKANAIAMEMILKKKDAVPKSKTEFNKWRKEVLTAVSDVLGNTPDIVKKSYVNPVVFEQWAVDPSWL